MGGDEVEAVISNLLYNEHPNATRIRPSQGDYGIDVLIPHPGHTEVKDVYQVKKFAMNLTESQKRQIEKSFRRALVGLIRGNVPVGDWYLVMPLDPTPENMFDWFNNMPDEVIKGMLADKELKLTAAEKSKLSEWREAEGRTIEWKGHLFCEALASKYWFVPDYYLHGGSDRIRAAVDQVAQILRTDLPLRANDAGDLTAVLSPGDIGTHLGRLKDALDGDPHFRYGLSLDPSAPELVDEPGLIAATQEISPDGSCITFRIYERFAEALNERPVPVQLRFEFEDEDTEAFETWRKYGKPFTSGASFNIDLPGGLGGEYENGRVRITPASGGETIENRYRISTPGGDVVGEALFSSVTATGLDGTGRWIHGSDNNGLLHFDALVDANDLSLRANFELGQVTGKSPVDALPALEFMAGLTAPNRLQVAGKYGPFADLQTLQESSSLIPAVILDYVRALAILQSHAARQIKTPDLSQVTMREARSVMRAASLVQGKTVVRNWKEVTVDSPLPDAEIDFDGHYQLSILKPLSLAIGGQNFRFGVTDMVMLSAKFSRGPDGVLKAFPKMNDSAHQFLSGEDSIPEGGSLPVRLREFPSSQ
ncbi:hypothetical protein [Streptomyces sp. NPDC002426]